MKIIAWLEGLDDQDVVAVNQPFMLCIHCSTKTEQEPASNDNVNSQLANFLKMEIVVSGNGIDCTPHKIKIGDYIAENEEAEFHFDITPKKLGEIEWQMDLFSDGESLYKKKFACRAIDFKPRFKQIKARPKKPEPT